MIDSSPTHKVLHNVPRCLLIATASNAALTYLRLGLSRTTVSLMPTKESDLVHKAIKVAERVVLIVDHYWQTFGAPIPQGALVRLSSAHTISLQIRFPDFLSFMVRRQYLVLLMNKRGQRSLLTKAQWGILTEDQMREISKIWRLTDVELFARPVSPSLSVVTASLTPSE